MYNKIFVILRRWYNEIYFMNIITKSFVYILNKIYVYIHVFYIFYEDSKKIYNIFTFS